jgi:hypothetical protein
VVELKNKLEAKKIRPGKKFEARTVEALHAPGDEIPAGATLKGRVSHVNDNSVILRFERIQTKHGNSPIVASVVRVLGERDVSREVGSEGEIRAQGGRGRGAAIGATVLGGIGAATGAVTAGGKGAAVGAGTGAGAGAAIGALAGGRDLVLPEETRLEIRLDRPLSFESSRMR